MSQYLDKRAIAGTGIEVSPLGLGTVKFGRNQGVKYPAQFAIPDDGEILRQLIKSLRKKGSTFLPLCC